MKFELHPSLAKKIHIIDLPLCKVLLQDESYYHWIILVPQRLNVSRIIDLSKEDQLLLLNEMEISQKIIWELFTPTQLNVAALGNKTPQLHIHIIARNSTDPAWPNTVWDHSATLPYTSTQKAEVLELLKNSFSKISYF